MVTDGDDAMTLTEQRLTDRDRAVFQWQSNILPPSDPFDARADAARVKRVAGDTYSFLAGRLNRGAVASIDFLVLPLGGAVAGAATVRDGIAVIILDELCVESTIRHEVAHLCAGLDDGHGPTFCRALLDAFVQFHGVDERAALAEARRLGVEVAERLVPAPDDDRLASAIATARAESGQLLHEFRTAARALPAAQRSRELIPLCVRHAESAIARYADERLRRATLEREVETQRQRIAELDRHVAAAAAAPRVAAKPRPRVLARIPRISTTPANTQVPPRA